MSDATPQVPAAPTAPTFAITRQFRAKESVPVAITFPDTGEPTGITLTLAGIYTDAFTAAQKAASAALTPDASDGDAIRALATHAVIAWDATDESGAPVPPTPETVAALYEQNPWIYPQVRRMLMDMTHFFERAKAS